MTQAFLAAFGGTAIEFFETMVIAYAVFRAGYGREVVSAVVVGHALVFAFAVVLFPLYGGFPLFWIRLAAAVMLLGMGLHWTVKSARRLRAHQRPLWVQDPLGKVNVVADASAKAFSPVVFLAVTKSAMVEGGEILLVVFPVAAATRDWVQVSLGVVCGMAAVTAAMVLLHGRLQRVPEVKLKLATGLLLVVIGGAWLGETLMGGASG